MPTIFRCLKQSDQHSDQSGFALQLVETLEKSLLCGNNGPRAKESSGSCGRCEYAILVVDNGGVRLGFGFGPSILSRGHGPERIIWDGGLWYAEPNLVGYFGQADYGTRHRGGTSTVRLDWDVRMEFASV